MNPQPGIDPDLLELIRAVDPVRHGGPATDPPLDTESALERLAPSLLPIPPRGQACRRRRSAFRAAALAVVAAAVAVVVVNFAANGNGGSGVAPAQARTILRHVRDALAWPPHAIYEERSVTTNGRPDGVRHTVEYHEWLSTSPPYDNRLIVIVNGRSLWEQAFLNGRLDFYNPTSNTIYLAPGVADRHVVGCQNCSSDTPQSNSALSTVRYLLSQPGTRIDRDAMLDGARAIKLTSDRGRFNYWISPRTYQPLQVTDRHFPGVTRYPIAQLLTGPAASTELLSLKAQHPGATTDHSQTAYRAVTQVVNRRGAQTGR